MVLKMLRARRGANPSVGSSRRRELGHAIRPMASTFCSPPESVPANCMRCSLRRGNIDELATFHCLPMPAGLHLYGLSGVNSCDSSPVIEHPAFLRNRLHEMDYWEKVKLLTVEVDRLRTMVSGRSHLPRRCGACHVAYRRCRYRSRDTKRCVETCAPPSVAPSGYAPGSYSTLNSISRAENSFA